MPSEPTSGSPAPVHFKGLNGLRALAALIVVFCHVGGVMPQFNLPRVGEAHDWAVYAVTLFFVLSGYLITYLLLTEKERTGTVSLKKFYLRRILRIWPLYYLVAGAVFVAGAWVSPDYVGTRQPWLTWPLYLFMLPNLAKALMIDPQVLAPFWSLGVEEQFYLGWPWLVKKAANLKRALATLIAVYLAAKLAVRLWGSDPLRYFVYGTEFDCMALGGLGAIWVKEQSPMLRWLFAPAAQVAAWGLFIGSTIFRPIHVAAILDHEFYAIFFLVMIVNVSANPASLVSLENRVLDYLGKISYGIYVYNILVICSLSHWQFQSPWQVYLLAPPLVIGLAALSYHLYESRFIRLKERFSVVPSRASMRQDAA